MFKEKSVRLIDINNGIDSANQQDSDFTSFLNIMNEWNARDAIRKIQAVFKSRMQDGKRISPNISYGYLRSLEAVSYTHLDVYKRQVQVGATDYVVPFIFIY